MNPLAEGAASVGSTLSSVVTADMLSGVFTEITGLLPVVVPSWWALSLSARACRSCRAFSTVLDAQCTAIAKRGLAFNRWLPFLMQQ